MDHNMSSVPISSSSPDLSSPTLAPEGVGIIGNTRRNGKPYSCEPCRRGKLRCDHRTPVCGRCSRRNKADSCIYHPAPLTKPKSTTPNRKHSPSRLRPQKYPPIQAKQSSGLVTPQSPIGEPTVLSIDRGQSAATSSVSRSPIQTFANHTPLDISRGAASSSATYASPDSMAFQQERTIGFLGPTSFSAVFTENEGRLGVAESEDERETETQSLAPIPQEKITQGAEVLALLYNLPAYLKFAERWLNIIDGFSVSNPVFRLWIEQIWTAFGPILLQRSQSQLENLSELVWQNTRRPMQIHGRLTMREWAIAASGRNLRWEVIGTILAMTGLIATQLDDWDSIFDELCEGGIDRIVFADRMRKASEFCLMYCYEAESINDIYVAFISAEMVLLECMKGSAHYAVWQRTGELSDACIALGLHQGNEPDEKTPFWLAETRKKMFLNSYNRDKSAASFLGRPPRLSYRYCKLDRPLELSDAELFLEGEELNSAVAALDETGGDRSDSFRRVTWLRDSLEYHRVREDILEIALGAESGDIAERADRCRRKLHSLQDPSRYKLHRITPEEAFDRASDRGSDGQTASSSVRFQRGLNAVVILNSVSGHLHTEFLLDRALVTRGYKVSQDLIPTCRRVFNLCLLACSRREVYRDFRNDFTYLLTTRGIPAAGVLALELLKQEQSRQYTPSILPRSEIIQDLSVFISALATVTVGDGNHNICQQGRRALRRVLDQILSPPPPPPPADMGDRPPADDLNFLFPTGNDSDFLQWLENVEWERGVFPSVPGPEET